MHLWAKSKGNKTASNFGSFFRPFCENPATIQPRICLAAHFFTRYLLTLYAAELSANGNTAAECRAG
jgi:hypothetical protein